MWRELAGHGDNLYYLIQLESYLIPYLGGGPGSRSPSFEDAGQKVPAESNMTIYMEISLFKTKWRLLVVVFMHFNVVVDWRYQAPNVICQTDFLADKFVMSSKNISA